MSQNKINFEFDTTNLNELQIRLIKQAVAMLEHVTHVEDEAEYFEASSELLRVIAQSIKFANFTKGDTDIEHAEQALQYCVDKLADQIYQNDVVNYDS